MTAKAIQQPITWDGERLPLRRAPMWMEHTYDVVVDELGVAPERFVELVESRAGAPGRGQPRVRRMRWWGMPVAGSTNPSPTTSKPWRA